MVGVFTLSISPLLVIALLPLILGNEALGISRNLESPNFDEKKMTRYFKMEVCFAIVLMTNALWNFFVYNLHVKEFRVLLRKFFGCGEKTRTKTKTCGQNLKKFTRRISRTSLSQMTFRSKKINQMCSDPRISTITQNYSEAVDTNMGADDVISVGSR